MKTFRLRLTDRRWTADPQGRVYLRGGAFAGGMLHRTAVALAARLPAPGDALPCWCDCLLGLNGFFALVCVAENRLVAAVDRVRSIPLFHGENAQTVFLSDDAEWVRRQLGDMRMDPVARDEFQLTGYVTGADTLYPRVKQLQAGELLLVEACREMGGVEEGLWMVSESGATPAIATPGTAMPDVTTPCVTPSDTATSDTATSDTATSAAMKPDMTISGAAMSNAETPDVGTPDVGTPDTAAFGDTVRQTRRYYRFLHAEPVIGDEAALRRGLEEAAVGCIRRLIEYAGGRQIVIPLSGGYDSRLIATLLREAGYSDILTFTYGLRGNREALYSREVARALGLPWHFIEYSEAAWRNAWAAAGPGRAGEGWRYQTWASGLASIPHVQDWLAVRMLSRAGRIAGDCVFVPGHSGDFVAGSHIPAAAFGERPIDTDLLVASILRQHYWRSAGKAGPRARAADWKARILDRAEAEHVYLPVELADAFEKWDWQERQAKFICNAVRIYEFFGYDWWMPLWDAEFMSFWEDVPLALRRQRLWYLAYVKQVYAAAVGAAPARAPEAAHVGPAISNALGNATDIGRPEAVLRRLIARISPDVREGLKAMRYHALPRRRAHACVVSHMPAAEVRRLEKAGFRGDDLLVQEFLRMAEDSRRGIAP